MRILYFRSVVPSSSFSFFSSPNLSGRRVHVYHTYLIAAIVMTFRVLEGHPHIARIFKCNFRILACLMVSLHLQSFLYSMLCCGVGFSGSLSGDVDSETAPSSRNQSPLSSVTYLLLQLHRRQCPLAVPVSAAEGNLRSLLAFRVDTEDDVLKQHLATAGKNAIYISKTTQNQLNETAEELLVLAQHHDR